MREIKFRARDNEGAWIYSKPMPDMSFWKWVQYDSTTIFNESTGLKDRHGVEIYEGDIIRIKNNHGYFIKKSVAWNNGNRWQGFRVGKGDREIEVIGNVYENPELLEAEL